jgi:hypothetical protein
MRLLLTMAGVMLLVVCKSASADPLDERGMHSSGIHAGRAMWAVRNCNLKPTDGLDLMGKLGLRAHPRSFEQGLEVGMTEALKVETNSSRQAGCTIAYIMYGVSGISVPGLLKWTGPVQAR